MVKTKSPKITLKIAWQQGYDAWGRGIALAGNPFKAATALFQSWTEGWRMAAEMGKGDGTQPRL